VAGEFPQRPQLARADRAKVFGKLAESGMSQRQIAAATGVSKGTVGNELGAQNWADDVDDIDAIPPDVEVIDAEPPASEPPRDPAVIAATRAAPPGRRPRYWRDRANNPGRATTVSHGGAR
jgi:hypothetical protein